MAEIDLPFDELMREPMLKGEKICTSRTKRYGKPGDTFKAFDADYQILAITRMPVRVVANYLYPIEGFATPEGFKAMWCRLHPRLGYVGDLPVYVHFFIKRTEPPTKTPGPTPPAQVTRLIRADADAERSHRADQMEVT
jgi:hypothetical protein